MSSISSPDSSAVWGVPGVVEIAKIRFRALSPQSPDKYSELDRRFSAVGLPNEFIPFLSEPAGGRSGAGGDMEVPI